MLPALAEAAQPALAAMGRLAAGARGAGVQVVHLTYLPLAGRALDQPALAAHAGHRIDRGPGTTTTPRSRWCHEIGVEPADLVLPRHQGISPVHRSEALTILRNMGMDELVVAGVSTNLAIPLTAAGAADEGFAVTVPTDASVGTPAAHHESMLRHSLAFVARLATTDELLAEWGSA